MVRTFMDSPVLGDTPIEWRYSQYRDFDGVRFPARIERRVADLPWYDLAVSAVRVNTASAVIVPPEVAANPQPSMNRIDVTELAPGVLNFGGGSHNSVIVDQKQGIVVIEAPLNEARSLAVIAKVHELFPGRKISCVINTHAHFDHAGGLRAFVAEGVKVVTHERNAAYYTRAWKQPRTLNPDALSASKRKPQFETFTVKYAIDDGDRPIEIHAIEGSGHNDAFAMVYLPAQKILVEADAWTPTLTGAKPPAIINPLWINLYANIERLANSTCSASRRCTALRRALPTCVRPWAGPTSAARRSWSAPRCRRCARVVQQRQQREHHERQQHASEVGAILFPIARVHAATVAAAGRARKLPDRIRLCRSDRSAANDARGEVRAPE